MDRDSSRPTEIPKENKIFLSCMETPDIQRRSLGKTVKMHDVLTNSQVQRPEEGCQKAKQRSLDL